MRIREYIINNPAGWEHDLETPYNDSMDKRAIALPTVEEIDVGTQRAVPASGEIPDLQDGGIGE